MANRLDDVFHYSTKNIIQDLVFIRFSKGSFLCGFLFHELRVTSYELRVAPFEYELHQFCELRVTSCSFWVRVTSILRVASYKLHIQITSYFNSTSYELRVAHLNHELLQFYELRVTSCTFKSRVILILRVGSYNCKFLHFTTLII